MHKIVILDGYTTNTGDLSWEPVSSLGEIKIYDRTAPEDVIARCAGADILITNKVLLTSAVLAELPHVKYIGLMSTGVNVVDLEYCDSHGIAVTNIPGYSTASVAQTTFAMILELCSRVSLHDKYVKSGVWTSCVDFTFRKSPIMDLCGKTIGIVGYGNIGKQVSRIAHSFDMKVLVYTRRKIDISVQHAENIQQVSFNELLEKSDIVTLHIPLTKETNQLINKESLAKMKHGSILINTARGGLINEADLASALHSAQLAGAGLDVLSTEPPKPDNPMLSCENCIITPHIAWASLESRGRLIDILAKNLASYINYSDNSLTLDCIHNLVNNPHN